jgi:hypothetical protein
MPEREKAVAEQEPNGDRPEKKPYVKPALRRLGSVRDLTHGGGCLTTSDGRRPMAAM